MVPSALALDFILGSKVYPCGFPPLFNYKVLLKSSLQSWPGSPGASDALRFPGLGVVALFPIPNAMARFATQPLAPKNIFLYCFLQPRGQCPRGSRGLRERPRGSLVFRSEPGTTFLVFICWGRSREEGEKVLEEALKGFLGRSLAC